jgi:hypothetical protein
VKIGDGSKSPANRAGAGSLACIGEVSTIRRAKIEPDSQK